MSNHIHLVVIPRNEGSLPKTMRETHRDFARWQNVRQRLTGHLWQNRYFSCPLDEAHCWETLRYVEMNPVRAGIVKEAWQWPWSSARAHLGIGPSGLVVQEYWRTRWNPDTWRDVLQLGVGEAARNERIRDATHSGRPLGGEPFLADLEARLQRPLRMRSASVSG